MSGLVFYLLWSFYIVLLIYSVKCIYSYYFKKAYFNMRCTNADIGVILRFILFVHEQSISLI